jgi:hypothetical protein
VKQLLLRTSANPSHPGYEDYDGMMSDHRDRHIAYCEKHRFEYIEHAEGQSSGIDKMRVILGYMKTGKYSHIFYVDADCFVVDLNRSMVDTLPEWSYIAMTIHPFSWTAKQPVFHFNAGMIYLKCTKKCIEFIERILDFDGIFQDEQQVMNWLLVGGPEAYIWQDGLNVLNCEWNNSFNNQPHDKAIVSAYHGFLCPSERRVFMRNVAKDYPF